MNLFEPCQGRHIRGLHTARCAGLQGMGGYSKHHGLTPRGYNITASAGPKKKAGL